jgi:hypothetical protein
MHCTVATSVAAPVSALAASRAGKQGRCQCGRAEDRRRVVSVHVGSLSQLIEYCGRWNLGSTRDEAFDCPLAKRVGIIDGRSFIGSSDFVVGRARPIGVAATLRRLWRRMVPQGERGLEREPLTTLMCGWCQPLGAL